MGIMESTPTGVETVNQIQLWLVICIVFVFLTVVIYALILCQMEHFKAILTDLRETCFEGKNIFSVWIILHTDSTKQYRKRCFIEYK